jgi:hypothetical protein
MRKRKVIDRKNPAKRYTEKERRKEKKSNLVI